MSSTKLQTRHHSCLLYIKGLYHDGYSNENIKNGVLLRNRKIRWTNLTKLCLWSPWFVAVIVEPLYNKKLSYCWETVRRESMPRIAEIDVEMAT